MEKKTAHYQFTQNEVEAFNYKYDCKWTEIHKYSFWFVSMDIDYDRSETYFDNVDDAYKEYERVKEFIQTYTPIKRFVNSQNKDIEISLMCHNVFKNEKNEDVFWKMNIRNDEFLELLERDTL